MTINFSIKNKNKLKEELSVLKVAKVSKECETDNRSFPPKIIESLYIFKFSCNKFEANGGK